MDKFNFLNDQEKAAVKAFCDNEVMKEAVKKIKERVDIVKGRNASTGEEEVLATVPGGQGSKVAAGLKSKGATSATVKSVA